VVGRKRKGAPVPVEEPVDLLARIGGRHGAPAAPTPVASEPTPHRRHDGPIDRETRARILIADPAPQAAPSSRPTMIGLDEPRTAASVSVPSAPQAAPTRPTMIGLEEALTAWPAPVAPIDDETVSEPPLVSVRGAPIFGEIDLVATPLPTPDEWHHFELALRKLRGIGELRTEYYRAGVLKVRVRWSGVDRFANAVRTVPGYRVRVLGEDRSTVQVLVGRR